MNPATPACLTSKSQTTIRSRNPSGWHTARFAGDHANRGVAHGIIGGPLALLSLAARRGIIADGQLAAISGICDWLRCWHTTDPAEPAWPYWISLPDWRDREHPRCCRSSAPRQDPCSGQRPAHQDSRHRRTHHVSTSALPGGKLTKRKGMSGVMCSPGCHPC